MSEMIQKSITVKGNVSEIFHMWANFENFPLFMNNIKSVRKTGEKTSHWTMESSVGDIEWDAQITEMQPNKRIAWNSFQGKIQTSGQVTFNDLSPDQTEVHVQLKYVAPAGKFGEAYAKIFDGPDKKLEEDLKRFKKYAESIVHKTSPVT